MSNSKILVLNDLFLNFKGILLSLGFSYSTFKEIPSNNPWLRKQYLLISKEIRERKYSTVYYRYDMDTFNSIKYILNNSKIELTPETLEFMKLELHNCERKNTYFSYLALKRKWSKEERKTLKTALLNYDEHFYSTLIRIFDPQHLMTYLISDKFNKKHLDPLMKEVIKVIYYQIIKHINEFIKLNLNFGIHIYNCNILELLLTFLIIKIIKPNIINVNIDFDTILSMIENYDDGDIYIDKVLLDIIKSHKSNNLDAYKLVQIINSRHGESYISEDFKRLVKAIEEFKNCTNINKCKPKIPKIKYKKLKIKKLKSDNIFDHIRTILKYIYPDADEKIIQTLTEYFKYQATLDDTNFNPFSYIYDSIDIVSIIINYNNGLKIKDIRKRKMVSKLMLNLLYTEEVKRNIITTFITDIEFNYSITSLVGIYRLYDAYEILMFLRNKNKLTSEKNLEEIYSAINQKFWTLMNLILMKPTKYDQDLETIKQASKFLDKLITFYGNANKPLYLIENFRYPYSIKLTKSEKLHLTNHKNLTLAIRTFNKLKGKYKNLKDLVEKAIAVLICIFTTHRVSSYNLKEDISIKTQVVLDNINNNSIIKKVLNFIKVVAIDNHPEMKEEIEKLVNLAAMIVDLEEI